MADLRKLQRCVKCKAKTPASCYYCGDAVCHYHYTLDERVKVSCHVCTAKFYLIWQEEKEQEHATELAYQEWMKSEASKHAEELLKSQIAE